MGLLPATLALFAQHQLYDRAEGIDAMACIECGSCAYVCPAAIPLVQHIRLAKSRIAAARHQRVQKEKEKEAAKSRRRRLMETPNQEPATATAAPAAAPPAAPKAPAPPVQLYEGASSPHLSAGDSVPSIMWTVVAALLPAAAVGVFYFGIPALVVLRHRRPRGVSRARRCSSG